MQFILRLNTDTNLGDVAARSYTLPNPDTNNAARTRGATELARANAAVLDRGRLSLRQRNLPEGDGLAGVPLGTILIVPPLTNPVLPFAVLGLDNRILADGEIHVLQRAMVDVMAIFQGDVVAESDAIITTALRWNATTPGTNNLPKTTIAVPTPPAGVVAATIAPIDQSDVNVWRTMINPIINPQAILDRRTRLTNRINDFNTRVTALQADLNTLLTRFTP